MTYSLFILVIITMHSIVFNSNLAMPALATAANLLTSSQSNRIFYQSYSTAQTVPQTHPLPNKSMQIAVPIDQNDASYSTDQAGNSHHYMLIPMFDLLKPSLRSTSTRILLPHSNYMCHIATAHDREQWMMTARRRGQETQAVPRVSPRSSCLYRQPYSPSSIRI